MKIAALALLVFGAAPTATAREDIAQNNNAADANNEQRNLFQDDENFWSRFVQEVTSSSFTEEPSAAPSEAPTEAPSAAPSGAPTGICFAEVSPSSKRKEIGESLSFFARKTILG